MKKSKIRNCDEFYIKAHPQTNKVTCTSTVFHIISEMLSRVYGVGSYNISINRFNKLLGFDGLGVDPKYISSKFGKNYGGGLEIKKIEGTLLDNPMPNTYKDYVLNCITFPVLNIDLVEVFNLIQEEELEWKVSLNYAHINFTPNRVDYHAVILLRYDEKDKRVYLYDPMDIGIPSGTKLSYNDGLNLLQNVDLDNFLRIWKFNPYDKINIVPKAMQKKLIMRLAWLLKPKNIPPRNAGKMKKQENLDVFGDGDD